MATVGVMILPIQSKRAKLATGGVAVLLCLGVVYTSHG